MKNRLLFAFFCALLAVSSCSKDDSSDPSSPPANSDLWGAGVNAGVYGVVMDENGVAVAGASVTAGSATTTTDNQGVFRINSFQAYEKLGYVKVQKTGYFPGSRSFVPVSGGNRVNIRLLSNATVNTVSGSTGGSVTNSQDATVEIAANSIVKNNTPYTGQVRVAIKHINPASDNFSEEMPGNLIGVQNNQSQGLTSYGMVGVELTDNSGQPLQIATGQTATVKFPINAQQQASAPSTIDLWSFDEQNGYWKHEGTATKQGSEYVAQVSHFSFWNCDVPGNWVTLQGQIVSASGQPIPGATITVTSTTLGSASDYTNGQGQFSGFVPIGQTLTITVQVSCNGGIPTTVYTNTIGPFASNTTLTPIAITIPGATQVTGTLVDCNNNALSSGYVIANSQVHFANGSGQFAFSACGSNITVYPYGTNPFVSGTSVVVNLTGGTQSMGNVPVCNGGGGGGTVTDNNGNTYATIQIGTQEWMQENLRTTKYRNGDVIPTGLNNTQWQNTTAGAWAYYNDSAQYNNPYGKLYNWYAVADSRGLCPTGWHVPSDSEWNILVKHLDPQADTITAGSQSPIAGRLMKTVGDLQSGTGLWQSPNTGATNSSGFSGLPGGFRFIGGSYLSVGYCGIWWSASEYSATRAWSRNLNYYQGYVYRGDSLKQRGFSVRCLRD